MTHQDSKTRSPLPTSAEGTPPSPATQKAKGGSEHPFQPAPVMWWDGGERAITVREKKEIEEHRESCFSIPLIPAACVGEHHPVAWVIHWRDVNAATEEVQQRRSVFLHNAVADFRTIDPGARVTPLYDATPPYGNCPSAGMRAIADERRRQVEAEGFSPEADSDYKAGELAKAALAYVQLAAMDLAAGGREHIATGTPPACWPWHRLWWTPRDARRDLVRAGALIAAQLDVIDSARDAAPEVARG